MTTNTVTDRIIAVDFGKSLEEMITAGTYDWTNPAITAKKFPIVGIGTKKFRAKLFHFGGYVSSCDAVAAMGKEKFLPGTHVHGLAFGAAFPDEQRTHPIACLGSSAQVFFDRFVVCLCGCGAGRDLDLCRWGDGWRGGWRFLGVQEVSGT